jgi:hypothetical protein
MVTIQSMQKKEEKNSVFLTSSFKKAEYIHISRRGKIKGGGERII